MRLIATASCLLGLHSPVSDASFFFAFSQRATLIQERVKVGLRNARAKGKRLGRPRVFVSDSKVEALRALGASWRTIAKELSVGIGTVRRAAKSRAKIVCGESFGAGSEVLHV